jgi:ferric-dicitrate binding protein FerR (iron transport regulator)
MSSDYDRDTFPAGESDRMNIRAGDATDMSGQLTRLLVSGLLAAMAMWLTTVSPAISQAGECRLIPDDRNSSEKILRCGDELEVRRAAGTRYRLLDGQGSAPPKALELDNGAVLIEFHPGSTLKNFQILTPHAVATVRGTRWAVEVNRVRSSTLVLAGQVAVARRRGNASVVLGPGEGVDVSPGTDPLVVKRWAEARVRALLARFGE